MSIRLEQVTKYYTGGAAVSDASLDIADAEFFVLLGPSGSGKSTLLRAIAGLTPIDHGRILLRGRDDVPAGGVAVLERDVVPGLVAAGRRARHGVEVRAVGAPSRANAGNSPGRATCRSYAYGVYIPGI